MRLLLLIVLLSSHISYACDTDVIILEGNSIAFCHGINTPITASEGFTSYSWTGPQTGSSAVFFPTQSGLYTITATDSDGCVSSTSIQVTIYAAPFGIINSSEGTVLCPGSSTVLSLSDGYTSYSWSTGSTQPIIFVSNPGVFSVLVTDVNGCTSNTSILISAPNFQLNSTDTLICSGQSATLQASGGNAYSWSTGQAGPLFVVSPDTTTTYSVVISQSGCSSTLEQTVYVIELPENEIQHDFIIGFGDVIFMNGPAGYDNYNWTPETNITLNATQGTTFFGTETSLYVLNSSHSAGCTRTDTFTVVVLKPSVPNGFSPNNDQLNDVLYIPELETYDGKLIVWNRWGDIVFESDDYQNNWDGTCQAQKCIGRGPLPEGTYFYQLEIEQLTFTGFTTLMR